MNSNWTREEIILACELTLKNDWKSLSAKDNAAIELSELLRSSFRYFGADITETFRNPNGVARKTADIATQHPDYTGIPTRGNKLDKVVLREFLDNREDMLLRAAAIRAELQDHVTNPPSLLEDILEDEIQAAEGRVLLVRHLRRERSRPLRAKKIAQVRRDGIPLNCEVCAFSFEAGYGERGKEYIEVHHILPLHASGPTVTKLEDLALVCSNCHRMIHRSKDWITPSGLRAIVRQQRDRNFADQGT